MVEQQIDELKNEILLLKQCVADHAQRIDTHTKDLEESGKTRNEMQTAMDQQSITCGRQIDSPDGDRERTQEHCRVQDSSVDREVRGKERVVERMGVQVRDSDRPVQTRIPRHT